MKLSSIFHRFYLLAFIVPVITFSGCVKNNSSTGDYLRFTIDGQKVESYATPAISFNGLTGIYSIGVSGFRDKNYSNAQIVINMSANAPITSPRAFSSTQLLTSGSIPNYPALEVLYYNASDVEYTSLFGDNSWTNIPGLSASATDAVVTIQEISATRIKGTFSCSVYLDTDITKKHTITNGEFNVSKY